MDHKLFYNLCTFIGGIPYLAVAGILIHYFVRRALWKRRSKRSMPGFCPSSAALGMVFLLGMVFYRPSLQHLVEARQVVEAEDDDQGGPDLPAKGIDRQLKRIRRGEPADSLTLRL